MPFGSTLPLRLAVVSVSESAAPVTATGCSAGVWAPAAAGRAAASRVRITSRRDIGTSNTARRRKFSSAHLASLIRPYEGPPLRAPRSAPVRPRTRPRSASGPRGRSGSCCAPAGATTSSPTPASGVREVTLPLSAGQDYAFVIDGVEIPDPASRWQPAGLRGPSRVLDTEAFAWSDDGFTPPDLEDTVIYELHVGTFTPEGTFEAVIPHLAGLRELGITTLELLPVAEFPGRHGWGYDGVYLSAAHSAYGGPHGLQKLVDAAHNEGLAILLDVVYNHVGASGVQALEAFGPYFTGAYETFWGPAINFDDADCGGVREWVLQSAEGWIRDFHLDGLRLDAVHAIFDAGAVHLVQALTARVHAIDPRALVIAESGMNDPKVVRSHERGGWGCDAVWADDFHHALRVLLTGDRSGYYEEFGAIGDLAKAYRRPHVHDGGYSTFRRRRFGARADDVPPHRFVVFDQNHDQVGNRAFGDRLPPEARPLGALCTLLSPFTPMLFQGEEHGEHAPFQFFADHIDEEIAVATREGRRREFAAFEDVRRGAGARPAGPGHLRAVQAHPQRRARGAARPLRAPARGAPRDRAPTRRTPTSTSTRAGCACAAASTSCWPTSRATRSTCRSTAPSSSSSPRTTRRSSPATSSCPRSRERWSDEPGGLARRGLPARGDLGRQRHQLLALLRARRARRAVPVQRQRQRAADRPDRAHRPHLALLPPGDRAGPALRLPRPRALRARDRASLQPRQAAARPVREVDRRPGGVGPGERAPVRPHRRRGRRPRARRRGRRRRRPEVGRDRPALRLGGRPPAEHAAARVGDLRDARARLHAAAPRGPRGAARHLRRPRLRARAQLPARPRRHRRRAAARPPHRRRVVPVRARPLQLLGLLDDRLLRPALRLRRHRPARPGGARVQGHGQGAAPRGHRGDPRRRLQPHRGGQPPRPDAVLQGRRQQVVLPARARRPAPLHGLHGHGQHAQRPAPERPAPDHGLAALLGDRVPRRRLPLRPRVARSPASSTTSTASPPSSTSSTRTRCSPRSS